MDAHEPASGLELVARFEKVPLGDVLDSLYALLSCQHGEWNWRKSGEGALPTYTFIETRQAKMRFEQAQALGQKALEDSVALMSRLAEMSPAERRKHRQEVAKIYAEKNAEILDDMFSGRDPTLWDEFLFFSRALTPEQQNQVLRGQTRVDLQVNNLASEAKTPFTAYYHFLFPPGTSTECLLLPLRCRTASLSILRVVAPKTVIFVLWYSCRSEKEARFPFWKVAYSA